MQRWSCWWCYKRRAAVTKRSDETCYPHGERDEHRQQSRCRRDPVPRSLRWAVCCSSDTQPTHGFPLLAARSNGCPPTASCTCLLSLLSQQSAQWHSADLKRYPPVPACERNATVQRAGPRAPGAWSDSAMEEHQYTAGAINTPPLSTLLGTVWYVQQYRVLWKEGGQRGNRRVRTGPGGKTRERCAAATQSTERPGTKHLLQFIFNIKTWKLSPTTDSHHESRLKDTLNTHKNKRPELIYRYG